MSKDELYEKLCLVIRDEETPADPMLAIAAAQGLLATLVLSYFDVTGKDITSSVLEALLRQINHGLDELEERNS